MECAKEHYFDEIFDCLKKNEDVYKMLLVSNGSIIFLEELKKLAGEKIYFALKDIIKNNEYLKLDINFYMDCVISELIKYFRGQSDYSSDELLVNSKKSQNMLTNKINYHRIQRIALKQINKCKIISKNICNNN